MDWKVIRRQRFSEFYKFLPCDWPKKDLSSFLKRKMNLHRNRSPLQPLKIQYRPYFEEFLDIQTTIKYGFILKRVRDMVRTCSQMHCTDKYSQHSSIIWTVWQNGWVFVDELSGCGFEARCSHLNFRCRPYFEEFLDVQANIECGFTLKRIRDMTRTYSRCW